LDKDRAVDSGQEEVEGGGEEEDEEGVRVGE
jgi:hypothetical protein